MDGEKIDRLIVLVCEYEELYDMANRNYSNQNRWENIWAEIGKRINESGQSCKKKWKSLRNAFQKAAKSCQTKSGQAATSTKKWKYWDAMSFLLPHIKGRETQTNVFDDETNENFENEVQTEESQLEETVEQTVDDESSEAQTSPFSTQLNTPQSRSSSVANNSRPVSRTASTKKSMTAVKKTEAKKTESLPEILKEYVQDKKRSRLEKQALAGARQITDGNSALFEFFTNMAKTTATFPPLWQAKVKSKVFELVNSYELALLETSSALPVPPLDTESNTHNQQQSHIQHTHNVSMHNQLPLQYQLPVKIQPSMQIPPSVQDQPPSSLFHHNEQHSLQGPSPHFYSSFASRVSATETSAGQNNVGETIQDLDMATKRLI